MKFHRTYHPASWSVQARRMAENQINQIISGEITEAEAIHFFSTSYRHPRIRYRAAKYFGRKMRKMQKAQEERKI